LGWVVFGVVEGYEFSKASVRLLANTCHVTDKVRLTCVGT
jgi:hypothetical protein